MEWYTGGYFYYGWLALLSDVGVGPPGEDLSTLCFDAWVHAVEA